MRALLPSLGLAGLAVMLCGCAASGGTGSGCTTSLVLGVGPQSGTANHSAAAPGNEQQFTAFEGYRASGQGCAVPALEELVYPAWTSSDPLDVTVSSAQGPTNGLATCVNATLTPVTLTATEGSGATAQTASVTMTCN